MNLLVDKSIDVVTLHLDELPELRHVTIAHMAINVAFRRFSHVATSSGLQTRLKKLRLVRASYISGAGD